MKILKEKINRRGKREVTVELDDKENLVAIEADKFYRIGYPIEDVVGGYIIDSPELVHWCSLEQKWV